MSNRATPRFEMDIDGDFRLSLSAIHTAGTTATAPVLEDLLTVAAAVARADRVSRRGFNWCREFDLRIALQQPARWTPESLHRLTSALQWLTGDSWSISITQSTMPRRAAQIDWLCEPLSPVVTFSGGVDSFAAAATTLVQGTCILSCTETSSRTTTVASACLAHLRGAKLVSVPLQLAIGDHAEPSYRTRTFVFFVAAAVTAAVNGSGRVVIGENGQGCLGPSVVRRYNEHPHRGAHPHLGCYVEDLFRIVSGSTIKFEFPFLWRTKSDVVAELERAGHALGLAATNSCSRPPSRQGRPGAPPHCGICAGCLLRRVAFEDRVPEAEDAYTWRLLDASTIEDAAPDFPTHRSDVELAREAVALLEQLATTRQLPSFSSVERIVLREVSDALGIANEVAQQHLMALLDRHSAEWNSFLERRAPSSWIRVAAGRSQ